MKNFKLTDETIKVYGKTLYRIECIKDFQHAKVGDKGGFVESEDNLSEEAWISGDACVYDNARVFDNAWVGGHTRIFGKARIFQDACVFGNAWVFGNARIFGTSRIFDNATIFEEATIFEDVTIFGEAFVYSNAVIFGSTEIGGMARVFEGSWSETPFQIQGSKHFVNMCSPTELKIGSDVHTLSFWKENFEEIVKKFKYTTEQIKEYKEYIDLAIEKYAEKC